jgi:hypothetical protein
MPVFECPARICNPTFHFDADTDPKLQIKAQNLEKVLKKAHFPYILTCHLQIDANADPDPDTPITTP